MENTLEAGNWYGGFYLPAEYREGGEWSDKAYKPVSGEIPYTYAQGHQAHQELRDFRQLHRVQDLYMLMILHERYVNDIDSFSS